MNDPSHYFLWPIRVCKFHTLYCKCLPGPRKSTFLTLHVHVLSIPAFPVPFLISTAPAALAACVGWAAKHRRSLKYSTVLFSWAEQVPNCALWHHLQWHVSTGRKGLNYSMKLKLENLCWRRIQSPNLKTTRFNNTWHDRPSRQYMCSRMSYIRNMSMEHHTQSAKV